MLRHHLVYTLSLIATLFVGSYGLSAQSIRFTTLREPGTTIQLSITYQGEITLSGVKEHYPSSKEPHEYTLSAREVVISGDVQSLRVSQAELTSLTITDCSSLVELDCAQNSLTSLDLTQAPALTKLACFANELTQITLPAKPLLTQLKCTNNKLSKLDLSSMTHLEELTCSNNELTALDLSALAQLKTLKCYSNKLLELNLSSCTLLEKLWCSDNQLRSLDLSNNSQLQVVWCYKNQIAQLSYRELPQLIWLHCEDNRLETLDCSHMPRLNKLAVHGNKLQDKAMTDLVASLPKRTATLGSFIAVNTRNKDEENVCTTTSATQATKKGWQVLDYCGGANDHQGIPYEGATTAIETVFPTSSIQFRWDGESLILFGLPEHSVVILYNLRGESLYTGKSSLSGELLIQLPEHISGPLLLTVNTQLTAKLYHP